MANEPRGTLCMFQFVIPVASHPSYMDDDFRGEGDDSFSIVRPYLLHDFW